MNNVNSVFKVFLFNKQFVFILITGLAITSLITSSFTLTDLYLIDLSIASLRGLNYHLVTYIASYANPWIIEEKYREIFEHNIVSFKVSIYIEAFEIPTESYIAINEYEVKTPSRSIVYFYMPGLNRTILYVKPSRLNETHVMFCGLNMTFSKHGFTNVVLRYNRAVLNTSYPFTIPQSIVIDKEFDRAYNYATGYSTLLPTSEANPYREIFKEVESSIDDFIYRNGPERSCSLIVFTDSDRVFKTLSNESRRINAKPLIIKLRDMSFESGRYSETIKPINTGRVLFTLLFLDPRGLSISVSVVTAVSSIDEYAKYSQTIVKQPDLYGVFKAPLYTKLINIMSMEQLFRISTAISVIPAFIIIWITASRIPPVMFTIGRRNIALLRIRGFSINVIRKHFIYAMILWLAPGLVLGIFTGPLLACLLYKGFLEINLYYRSMLTFFNPLTLLTVFAISVVLMTGSIISVFKSITRIQPIEFMKPQVLVEEELSRRGFSTISLISLLLGIYYVFRTTFINPYAIKPVDVLTLILQLILLLLETIVLLFGPVLLIYGVSSLLVSYPHKISIFASKIASLLAEKYNTLVARFIEVKPTRLALIIILSSFSISLLLGGLAASDATNNMFNRLGSAVHGNIDYLVVRPVFINSSSTLNQIILDINSVSKYINGTFTYSIVTLGVTSDRVPERVSESTIFYYGGSTYSIYRNIYLKIQTKEKILYIPIGYVIFISRNYSSVVDSIDSIGYTNSFKQAIKNIEGNSSKGIYVFNPHVEKIYRYEFDQTPYTGRSEIYLGSTYVTSIDIDAVSINTPVIGGLRQLPTFPTYSTTLSQAGVYSIPIYAPDRRGLILSIDKLNDMINSLRYYSNTSYFGYSIIYVKGSIINRTDVITKGYMVISLADLKWEVDNINTYVSLSKDYTVAMGIALYIITLIVISLLTYSIIYENLNSYTLMRGRGISSREIYRISFAEAFTIAILSIIPGLLIGVFLGYGLPALSTQVFGTADIYMDTAYGIVLLLTLSNKTLLILIVSITIPIIVSWLIINTTYRRVVREALSQIGSLT